MWKFKDCQTCTERHVGCHSQCQKYIVAKTIHTYKQDKVKKEEEIKFNYAHYERLCSLGMRKVQGFKRKTYSACG